MHFRWVLTLCLGMVFTFASCKTRDCELIRVEKRSENGGPTLVRCLESLKRDVALDNLLKRTGGSNSAATVDRLCQQHCNGGRLAQPETLQRLNRWIPPEKYVLVGRRSYGIDKVEAIDERLPKMTGGGSRSKKLNVANEYEKIEPLCVDHRKKNGSFVRSYYHCKDSRPWQAFLCECDVEITCEVEKPCTYRHFGDVCEPATYKWPSAAAAICQPLECSCNPCEGQQWTSWAPTATCGKTISYRFRPENRSVQTSCLAENTKGNILCCTQLVNVDLGSCNEVELKRVRRDDEPDNNTGQGDGEPDEDKKQPDPETPPPQTAPPAKKAKGGGEKKQDDQGTNLAFLWIIGGMLVACLLFALKQHKQIRRWCKKKKSSKGKSRNASEISMRSQTESRGSTIGRKR